MRGEDASGKTRRRHRRAQPAGDLRALPDVAVGSRRARARSEAAVLRHQRRRAARRYADTRRRHPLSHLGLALADAIALERQALKPLAAIADVVIDTSELNVHQLRRQVITEFGLGEAVEPVAAVRILRLPPRRAAGRGLRVRCALPAQPALGRAPAPAVGPRRGRPRLPGGAAGRAAVRRPDRAVPRHLAAAPASRTRAATSRSPSAAPAGGIARCTWPNAWRGTAASGVGPRLRCTIASWTDLH